MVLAIIGAVFVFAFVGVAAGAVAYDGADHNIKNGNNKDQVTCVCVFFGKGKGGGNTPYARTQGEL